MRNILLLACLLLAACTDPKKARYEAFEHLGAYKNKPIHYLSQTLGEPTDITYANGMSHYVWRKQREMPLAVYTSGAASAGGKTLRVNPASEDLTISQYCSIIAIVDKQGIMVNGGIQGNSDATCAGYYNKLISTP